MSPASVPGPRRVLLTLCLGGCFLTAAGASPAGAQGGTPADPPVSSTPTTAPSTTAAPSATAAPSTTAAPRTTARPATTAAPRTTARPATTSRPATTAVEESEDPETIISDATPAPTTATPTTAAPTTAVPSTSAAPVLEERVTESDEATTRLNSVVVALLVLAGIIAVVTVLMWRATRPAAVGVAAGSSAYWVGDSEAPDILLDDGSVAVNRSAWTVDPAATGSASTATADALPPPEPQRGPDVQVDDVDGGWAPHNRDMTFVDTVGGSAGR